MDKLTQALLAEKAVQIAEMQYGKVREPLILHACNDILFTSLAMRNYGGHFEQGIGTALKHADTCNVERICRAFPDLIEKFGPGTRWHEHAKRVYQGEQP